MTAPELVLVGATGYTGRLVAHALARRKMPFTIAGRREEALDGLIAEIESGRAGEPTATRPLVLNVESREDVDAIAGPEHVVLSCAGPFNLLGRTLARAVALRGGTYADVSGEEPFAAWLMEELAEPAQDSGALLIPSCAFESFLTEMLVDQICSPNGAYQEIASYYHLEGHATSPGTALTMRLVPHWAPSAFIDGIFVPTRPGAIRRSPPHACVAEGHVAVFAPYPEIRFWGRRYRTESALSFLVVSRSEAALLGRAPRSKRKAEGAGTDIEAIVTRHRQRSRPGPAAERRASQRFSVMVQATDQQGATAEATVVGSDPYGLTADILAWVGQEVLNGNVPTGIKGVRTPGEVFDPRRFFEAAAGWEQGLARP